MSCHDFLQEDPKGQFMSASYFNTVEDVQKVRRDRGLDASRKETMHMIRSWLGRNKCAQRTEHSYEKDDKFKNKTV